MSTERGGIIGSSIQRGFCHAAPEDLTSIQEHWQETTWMDELQRKIESQKLGPLARKGSALERDLH